MAYTGKKPVDHTDVTQSQSMTVTDDLTVDTNTLYVDSTNNRVGIGTTSPSASLHISGNIIADNTAGSYIQIKKSGTNSAFVGEVESGLGSGDGLLLYTYTGTDRPIIAYTNGSEAMRITSAGRVGIGTSSPLARFDVESGTGNVGFNYGTLSSPDRGNLWYDTDGTGWRFNIGKVQSGSFTSQITIQDNGNVGIGTSSPNSKLHVRDSTDIAMSNSADGQFVIEGNGYSGAIALNATGMQIYQNSSARNIIFGNNETEQMRIDSSGNVTLGAGGTYRLDINAPTSSAAKITCDNTSMEIGTFDNHVVKFLQNNTERMRINSDGDFMFAKTTSSYTNTGIEFDYATGRSFFTVAGQYTSIFNRKTNDGIVIYIAQDSTLEGSISVSGTTVSYNGGHLARWSQLTDGTKDETIVKGTVMTNLDQMAVWSHDAVEAQDAVYDEDGNVVTEAVEAKDAYTEDNEQLNCMAVSSVEGDPNVAGVFVNWDNDDDEFNDMNIAMTGDMVIRIAQGTTVARGDLLMSAGDGTAKPQGDDIVRSKTIAKVTSTNVSHTYDDGSYLVPCVLMAC